MQNWYKGIVRDRAQCMGTPTEKQFVCLTQNQGRDTYPERGYEDILSNEEEGAQSGMTETHLGGVWASSW